MGHTMLLIGRGTERSLAWCETLSGLGFRVLGFRVWGLGFGV